jgi:hypothetical protein
MVLIENVPPRTYGDNPTAPMYEKLEKEVGYNYTKKNEFNFAEYGGHRHLEETLSTWLLQRVTCRHLSFQHLLKITVDSAIFWCLHTPCGTTTVADYRLKDAHGSLSG